MRFTLAVLTFITFPFIALAQDFRFAGQTYFTQGRFDRIYFDADGSFQQQLENGFQTLPPGTILYGDWVYEPTDNLLCMKYSQFGIGRNCFTISEIEYEIGSSKIAATGTDGKRHFIWPHIREGNWLMTPQGLQALSLAVEGRNIKNSIIVDKMIADYFTGKVFEGFGYLVYAVNENEGIFLDAESGQGVVRNWSVQNLRTIAKASEDGQGSFFDFLFTLGTEFLIPKPRQAYYYISKDHIMVEGEDFTLTPYDEFEDKQVFEPYLSQINPVQ